MDGPTGNNVNGGGPVAGGRPLPVSNNSREGTTSGSTTTTTTTTSTTAAAAAAAVNSGSSTTTAAASSSSSSANSSIAPHASNPVSPTTAFRTPSDVGPLPGSSSTSTHGRLHHHQQQEHPHNSGNSNQGPPSYANSSASSTSPSPWPQGPPSASGSNKPNATPSKSADPHNNGARAALTNEIRAEFFRLYEQSGFQVPGLNPQNILRHKDKDLHFEGHDGLRDFWKQSAASRREILQLAREGHIRVVRGPPPPLSSTHSHAPQLSPSAHPQMMHPSGAEHPEHVDPLNRHTSIPGSEPPTNGVHNTRKRSHPMSSSSASPDAGSSTSSKRQQSFPNSTEEWPSSMGNWGQQRVGVNAVSRLVHTLQNALDDYASPSPSVTNGSLSSQGGSSATGALTINQLQEERDAALARIVALERERDEAFAVRDQALKIAEESYMELRAVVDSRFRRIRDLKDTGGAVPYDLASAGGGGGVGHVP